MNIVDTFGYQLAESRVAKGWTEREVAEAVNKSPRQTCRPFTEQNVKDWQELKAVPAREIVEILAIKLIDQNTDLDESRKEKMRTAFVNAADRDRDALAGGDDLHDLFLEGQSPFGKMLNALRSKKGITEAKLAALFDYQEEIEAVTKDMILRFQFGLEKPSPALAKRIAAVMELDLADIVEPEEPTFAAMVRKVNNDDIATTTDEETYDFEEEAARIGLELRCFLTAVDELALLPQCMKPRKRGDLEPLPGSEAVPYKEGGTATARIITAMTQQLNESGALLKAADLKQWRDISGDWRELAAAYQRQCREAGVETANAIG